MLNYSVHATHDGRRNFDGGRNARGLLASIDAAVGSGSSAAAAMQTSCHVHQALSFWGVWDLLLPRIGKLSLISCQTKLPDVLADRFGVEIENAYFISPERKYAARFKDTRTGRHYPDQYEELRGKLADARPGQVFLVAAGMLGKIYCMWIRQAGGIAIDIGSAADFWCGHETRGLADIAIYRSPAGVTENLSRLLAAHPRYRILSIQKVRSRAAVGV